MLAENPPSKQLPQQRNSKLMNKEWKRKGVHGTLHRQYSMRCDPVNNDKRVRLRCGPIHLGLLRTGASMTVPTAIGVRALLRARALAKKLFRLAGLAKKSLLRLNDYLSLTIVCKLW